MSSKELLQRIERLSPVQRLLLSQRLAQRANGAATEPESQQGRTQSARLVAFATAQDGKTITGEVLRSYLKERLPEYMVPAECVVLPELPHLPNGKIDRSALATLTLPARSSDGNAKVFAQPATSAVLEKLRAIWAEVLGFDEINPDDNFFEVGGDSILSIQIVARSAKAGIRISPTQIFDHPTIAELAQVVESTAVAAQVAPAAQPTDKASSDLILSPIQQWLLEQKLHAPQHWNQSVLLQAPSDLNSDRLEQALNHLLQQHDALRLQFEKSDNEWRQFLDGGPLSLKLHRHNLSTVADDEIRRIIELHATKIHASLSLNRGALVAAAHFDCGKSRTSYLLLVVHHLVIDAVSWGILLGDLATLYQQMTNGERSELAAKSTSFQEWTQALKTAAQSEMFRNELAHWRRLAHSTNATIPLDFADADLQLANQNQWQQTVSMTLGVEATRALLHESAAAYNTQVNDLLLAALMQTLGGWTGRSTLLFGMEGHGREELGANLDLSRLVGWLTSYFPVELTVESQASPAALIKTVKEQVRQTPNRGIGYGLLRYLSDDTTVCNELATLQSPPLLFNYLGQIDRQQGTLQPFAVAQYGVGQQRHPADPRPVQIEINARVERGDLHLEWSYSEKLHQRQTIEQLATDYCETLHRLITHCSAADVATFTPSDFPLAGIDQTTLDLVVTQNGSQISDLYTLSPMQELMLVASASATHSDLLVTQARYRLHGQIDVARFQQAWQAIIDRHPALRTGFIWQGVQHPLQFVQRTATLPFTFHNLTTLPTAEQEAACLRLRNASRQQCFDLARPSLMRVSLIQLSDDAYEMVWDCHHLVVDRWCNSIVLNELLARYSAAQPNRVSNLPAANGFAEYIGWLQKQSPVEAQQFWREQLGRFAKPALLTDGQPSRKTESFTIAETSCQLSGAQLETLQLFARSHNLTLSTLLHGAWLLLLGRYTQQSQVITGVTVSGRPPTLPGAESMIGSFINNLPLAVEIDSNGTLHDWLNGLQRQMITLRQYDSHSPATLHAWSQLPPHLPLFDTLLVFQSASRLPTPSKSAFAIEELVGTLQTNYPFTLAIAELDRALLLRASYHVNHFTAATAATILDDLCHILTVMVTDSALSPGALARHVDSTLKLVQRQTPQQPSPIASLQAPWPLAAMAGESLSNMEQAMAAIWCEILRLPAVAPTASYFELGGTSLQAMHLFTRMNEHFGSNLSLTTLIHAPTIRQLCQLLGDQRLEERATGASWTPLVPLQTEGTMPPFFCIHGITGDVLWFRELGRCLAPDQPLYGIQACGLDGVAQPLRSIEAMAARYLAEIRKIQAQGPYYFGGASFGGTVALEMAQQLVAQGERVGLLVMFDHAPMFNITKEESALAQWQKQLGGVANVVANTPQWTQSMLELGWQPAMARLRRKIRTIGKKLAGSSAQNAGDLLDYGDQLPVYRQQLIEANMQALANYRPQPYAGEVTLFQASAQPLLSTVRPRSIWQSIAGQALDVAIVPGSHEGIFRPPHVEQLAQQLRQRMEAANPQTLTAQRARPDHPA